MDVYARCTMFYWNWCIKQYLNTKRNTLSMNTCISKSICTLADYQWLMREKKSKKNIVLIREWKNVLFWSIHSRKIVSVDRFKIWINTKILSSHFVNMNKWCMSTSTHYNSENRLILKFSGAALSNTLSGKHIWNNSIKMCAIVIDIGCTVYSEQWTVYTYAN